MKYNKIKDYEVGLWEFFLERKDNKIILKLDFASYIARYDIYFKLNKNNVEFKKEEWDLEKIKKELMKKKL